MSATVLRRTERHKFKFEIRICLFLLISIVHQVMYQFAHLFCVENYLYKYVIPYTVINRDVVENWERSYFKGVLTELFGRVFLLLNYTP